jgi:hypothetical protein
VGYDVDREARAGGTVHVVLYWRMSKPDRYLVTTQLGDVGFETHELGFGNLERFVRTTGRSDGIVVEEYDLVVLSSIRPGDQPFVVRVGGLPARLLKTPAAGAAEDRRELTRIHVEK